MSFANSRRTPGRLAEQIADPGSRQADTSSDESDATPPPTSRPAQGPIVPVPAPKERYKTTYYVGRKPVDLPRTDQFSSVADIDYQDLPLRTDTSVKRDVNSIIQEGITKKLMGERSMKTGISGAVRLLSD